MHHTTTTMNFLISFKKTLLGCCLTFHIQEHNDQSMIGEESTLSGQEDRRQNRIDNKLSEYAVSNSFKLEIKNFMSHKILSVRNEMPPKLFSSLECV